MFVIGPPMKIYVCRECEDQYPCVVAQPLLVPDLCPYGKPMSEWELVWTEYTRARRGAVRCDCSRCKAMATGEGEA
jgi:hypothetical protein